MMPCEVSIINLQGITGRNYCLEMARGWKKTRLKDTDRIATHDTDQKAGGNCVEPCHLPSTKTAELSGLFSCRTHL